MSEELALTDAERQLIDMIREGVDFTVSIHKDGDRWNVAIQDHDSGVNGTGAGPSFDIAWDDVADPRLRNWQPEG